VFSEVLIGLSHQLAIIVDFEDVYYA